MEDRAGHAVSGAGTNGPAIPKAQNEDVPEILVKELEALSNSLNTQDYNQWQKVVREVTGLANKGYSSLFIGLSLMLLGAAILLVSLVMKLQPAGLQISELQPLEFITAFIIGTLLLILGALLPTYSYRVQVDQRRLMAESSESLIRDNQHQRADIIKNYVDARINSMANNRFPGSGTTAPIRPGQDAEQQQ